MRLLIRADTRPGVGTGRALRQVALAEEWRPGGGEVVLAVDDPRALPTHVVSRLDAVGEVVDAAGRALARLAEAVDPDVVTLDGYDFSQDRQAEVRTRDLPLAVVDDHGRIGGYEADVVVDQNEGPACPAHARRPAGSALLHGPRFALLRREFSRITPVPTRTSGPARVVVVVGGAGPDAAETLRAGIEARLGDRASVTTPARAGCTDHVAPLLAGADVVVSASGSTAWELAHLGRPMVLFAVADNQLPVGATLARAGAARWLGAIDPDDPGASTVVADALEELLADAGDRRAMASAGAALVDGRGARRVATELRSLLLDLRPAVPDDGPLLWRWANDPEVRAASFDSEPIPLATHLDWFARRLADPATRLLVAEDADGPWGQVRFEGVGPGTEATIGVSIAAERRGRGLGAPLVRGATRRLLAETGATGVLAWVKPSNDSSLAAFEAADYERVTGEGAAGLPAIPAPGAVPLRYVRGRDGRT